MKFIDRFEDDCRAAWQILEKSNEDDFEGKDRRKFVVKNKHVDFAEDVLVAKLGLIEKTEPIDLLLNPTDADEGFDSRGTEYVLTDRGYNLKVKIFGMPKNKRYAAFKFRIGIFKGLWMLQKSWIWLALLILGGIITKLLGL